MRQEATKEPQGDVIVLESGGYGPIQGNVSVPIDWDAVEQRIRDLIWDAENTLSDGYGWYGGRPAVVHLAARIRELLFARIPCAPSTS
jgi:hypothetical protein